ncbi:MAG: hypothetical protein AABZ74_04970 [Cyanobacteriota bacterium]
MSGISRNSPILENRYEKLQNNKIIDNKKEINLENPKDIQIGNKNNFTKENSQNTLNKIQNKGNFVTKSIACICNTINSFIRGNGQPKIIANKSFLENIEKISEEQSLIKSEKNSKPDNLFLNNKSLNIEEQIIPNKQDISIKNIKTKISFFDAMELFGDKKYTNFTEFKNDFDLFLKKENIDPKIDKKDTLLYQKFTSISEKKNTKEIFIDSNINLNNSIKIEKKKPNIDFQVKSSIDSKLKDKMDDTDWKKYQNNKGHFAIGHNDGIKELEGKGIDGFKYEIKIHGTGSRLLGNKDKDGLISFTKFKNKHV